jgi:hypothetical protein
MDEKFRTANPQWQVELVGLSNSRLIRAGLADWADLLG